MLFCVGAFAFMWARGGGVAAALRLISAPPARKRFSLPPSISVPDFAECPPNRPHRCGLFRERGRVSWLRLLLEYRSRDTSSRSSGKIELYHISVNRHFAEIRGHVGGAELRHLRFNHFPFLRRDAEFKLNIPLALCHRSTLRVFGLRRNFRRSCFRQLFQHIPDRGFLLLLRVGFAGLTEKQIDQTGWLLTAR